MKQAFLDERRKAEQTRDGNPGPSKQTKKESRPAYGSNKSNNFLRADEQLNFKKCKKKNACNSPTNTLGNKRLKIEAKEGLRTQNRKSKQVCREDKNLNRKQGQNPVQNTHYLNQYQQAFKNKQSKDSNRIIHTARGFGNKKIDVLGTDRFKKYTQMLSPSRTLKQKTASMHSKKMLRSTQETFRAVSKNTGKQHIYLGRSPTRVVLKKQEPKQYILLENHFLSIDHDEACLLDQKISFNKSVLRNFPNYLFNDNNEFFLYDDESASNDKTFEKSQPSFDSIQKIITIQRWWRAVLKRRQLNLRPILFEEIQPNQIQALSKHQQSYKQQSNSHQQNTMCPLHFIEGNNSNISMNADSRQIERKLNPLELRQQLAKQQLRVHKQLLQKLLKLGKISSQIHSEKIKLTEAKFHGQMQKINDIKRILSENTKIVHEMTQKLKEDCGKIDNIDGQLSKSMLDQIFGSKNQQTNVNQSSNQRETVINRQKSNGCHHQTKEQTPSLYAKDRPNNQQEYQRDFEGEELQAQSEQSQQSDHNYNTNFSQIIEQYKKEQEAAMQIDQRAALQMGMGYSHPPEDVANQTIGIDSSLNGIHNFLLSFFKFYLCNYKDQFLRLINMPYGYDVSRRIKFLQGNDIDEYYPQEDEEGVIYGLEDVIHEDILDEYYETTHSASQNSQSTTRRVNYQFEKIHHRALFDCFNAALNQFRPYFQINGTPYPWNYSEKALTFYCIAEQNIQQVFEKTQLRVLKWASSLCGIIVQRFCSPCLLITPSTTMQDALDLYKNSTNPSLFKAREERFNRDLKSQINENSSFNWGVYEDQLTLLQLQCSDYALNKAVQEFVLQFYLSGLFGKQLNIQQEIKAKIGLRDEFYQQDTQQTIR